MSPKIALGATSYGSGALPNSVDLRQWAPAAGDQGSLNSCVSWAIGHTLLEWYANRMGTPTDLAPMFIYSQTHLTNSSDGGGSYVRDAMSVVSVQGIDTSADYQPQGDYNFTTAPTSAQVANAAAYKTTGYTRLWSNINGVGAAAQTAIEQSLANNTPVGLAIPIYNNFYYLNNSDYNLDLSDATGSNYGY